MSRDEIAALDDATWERRWAEALWLEERQIDRIAKGVSKALAGAFGRS